MLSAKGSGLTGLSPAAFLGRRLRLRLTPRERSGDSGIVAKVKKRRMKYKDRKRRNWIKKMGGSGDGMCGVQRGESGMQIPRN
jgi:hypothetical protein